MSGNRTHGPGTEPKPRHLLGVSAMVTAMVMLPAMDAIAKWLSASLHVLEIVWVRCLIYALVTVFVALRKSRKFTLEPASALLQLMWGILMARSAWAFFSAVGRMALADAMAVFFVYPFLVLLLSSLFGGEAPGLRLWVISGVGFAGALISVHPTMDGIPPGAPFALCAGVAYALSMVITRRLAKRDSPIVTTARSPAVGLVAFSLRLPFI